MAPHDDRAPEPEQRDNLLLALVTGLSVVSSILGRALAPALPGSVAGITGWIKAFDRVSGFLAQLFAIAGILVATRMVTSALLGRFKSDPRTRAELMDHLSRPND